jgi:glycosyltransferase involved in cell wall biosynthesis
VNVLHVIQCLNLGGMEHAALQFCELIEKHGHQVSWISLSGEGPLRTQLTRIGARVECLDYNLRKPLRTYQQQRRALCDSRYERLLMTGHNLSAMLAISPAKDQIRVLSQHYHHRGVKSKASWKVIYSVAQRRFRWITFPSAFVRDEAVRIHPGIEKNSVVLRNAVRISRPPSEAEKMRVRERLGVSRNQLVIGNAGWLITRKRFDVFLRVVRALVDLGVDVCALIAGGGPLEAKLRELCTTLHLASRVKFLGWRNDLKAFYNCIDILLFNTDWDAFSMTAIEAMSSGVPVVASVVNGGLPELYTRDAPIQVLPNHEIATLARNVLRAASEPNPVRAYQLARLGTLCDPTTVGNQLCSLLEVDRNAA